MTPQERATLAAAVRKRARDRALRDVLLQALAHPDLRPGTRVYGAGITLEGPGGRVGTHWSAVESPRARLTTRRLRSIGLLE